MTRKLCECKECGKIKPHAAKGLCTTCYSLKHSHIIGKYKSMGDNKSCSLYLGVNIAERVLSKVFENVQLMPNNNIGFDFVCGKGYKIDVKSGCETDDRWLFRIKRNTVADYFLCVAFDNREDLNPAHLWLIPKRMISHLVSLSISKSKIYKWNVYELDIDKVISCCNIIRG